MEAIAIVGASLAGLRAAEALRGGGFEGRLVLVGDEPHAPYDRPPLSKEVLRGDWEPDRTSLLKEGALDKLELDLRLGRRAESLDLAERSLLLDDGARVGFHGLVLACGARVRTLPGTPPLAGIHTLRTLDDCLAIRDALGRAARVAVVGAGFIGAEVAATCRERGLDVTLVEALPVPLERAVGRDVGELLAAVHSDRGVDVRLGVGVEGFLGSDRVEALRLADGSRVEADVVVVGVGVTPNTEWLEGSGLTLDDGVLCDATCAASAEGVVAAGDVARWPNPLFDETMRIEHWSNATEQGMHAAATLLAGAGAEPFATVPFFWSDQYDLKIQSAGRTGDADQTRIVAGSLAERRFLKLYGRRGRFCGALAVNEPRRLIKCRRALRKPLSFEEAALQLGG